MRTEPLGIHHKELLVPRLKIIKTPLSEYTFANLYLFRKSHAYEVSVDDELFIKGRTYDGHTFIMPTRDIRTMDKDLLRHLTTDADFLFPIPEEWFPAFDSDEFDISFTEGDADYVYSVERMSTYQGRNLHKKRNLLKQFLAQHRHEARPLTNDRIEDARRILKDWMAESDMKAEDTDFGPCLEALDRYEELLLCGGIYYANDEPAGFVLGEELGENTYVLHFAKARIKFKGIYQYMFNNFAGILPPKYLYLNLEQDLDKDNLRIFKSSYVPAFMLRKARVRIIHPCLFSRA